MGVPLARVSRLTRVIDIEKQLVRYRSKGFPSIQAERAGGQQPRKAAADGACWLQLAGLLAAYLLAGARDGWWRVLDRVGQLVGWVGCWLAGSAAGWRVGQLVGWVGCWWRYWLAGWQLATAGTRARAWEAPQGQPIANRAGSGWDLDPNTLRYRGLRPAGWLAGVPQPQAGSLPGGGGLLVAGAGCWLLAPPTSGP